MAARLRAEEHVAEKELACTQKAPAARSAAHSRKVRKEDRADCHVFGTSKKCKFRLTRFPDHPVSATRFPPRFPPPGFRPGFRHPVSASPAQPDDQSVSATVRTREEIWPLMNTDNTDEENQGFIGVHRWLY
jgi:hypothetical protein